MTRLVLLSLLAGCAANARFADRKILWRDPDDAPVPLPPVRRDAQINWEGERDALFRPADRFFSLDYGGEAANVNALDEVPDSSWFTDRRRLADAPDDQPRFRVLEPDEIARGAVRDEDVPQPPYTIVEGKTVGSARGFVVVDARGARFMFKLDPPGVPQLVTSTQAVASRLAWAAGWNVPADSLVDVSPEELTLAPDAKTKDSYDHPLPFTPDRLRLLLHGQWHDGRMRVLASRWIDGRLLGWFDYYGLDRRDHNDRVRHEDRRDLRGFGVWAAWVDDVDTLENNTLDSYVGEPGAGHVVHYQQDVGKSFGVFATKPVSYWMGQESYFAPGRIFASLFTLGLLRRPWYGFGDEERARAVERWPQLGFFDGERFSPRAWQPVVPNAAFARQTRRDRYWGAKRVTQFSRDEIRAAVSAGQYPPDVAEHLIDVLWARRQKIARAWFADVAPLDGFRFDGERLCFDDLWLQAGLGGEAATRYEAREDGAPLVLDGRCARLVAARGYHVVALRAQRPGERHFGPTVRVHLVARPSGRHIVGIER